jgi:8-oxo-dGTP pyrophosphatase MutT (NUDIX family)
VSRWQVHGERTLYSSDWLSLRLTDVELPDGRRFEHHVIRIPRPAVMVLVVDDDGNALMLHRHRFILDRWGWELPAGRVEDGETLEDAGARETVEETGWRPLRLERLVTFHPAPGLCDIQHWIMLGRQPERLGEPDPAEASRVEWMPGRRALDLIRAGEVPDGYSQHALLLATTLGHL